MNFDSDIQDLAKAFLDEDWFHEFEIINDSYVWEISIVFVSGTDERDSSDIPPPYVKNTGAIVGGVSIAPRSSNKVYVQPEIKCQANRLQCRANLRNVSSGKEFLDFRWKDVIKPIDEYIPSIIFRLQDGNSLQSGICAMNDAPFISKVLYRTARKSAAT
jgi:hypothetical protein